MPNDVDRFLAQTPIPSEGPSLGRIFAVERETWLLSEDPQAVAPRVDLLVSRRTALDAADTARTAAAAYVINGFHKPSGAWWASDGVRFHRFRVRRLRQRGDGLAVGSGLALFAILGVAVFGAFRKSQRRRRSRA